MSPSPPPPSSSYSPVVGVIAFPPLRGLSIDVSQCLHDDEHLPIDVGPLPQLDVPTIR